MHAIEDLWIQFHNEYHMCHVTLIKQRGRTKLNHIDPIISYRSYYSICVLDLEWVSKVRVNTQAVLKRAQQIQGCKVAKKQWQVTIQRC